MPFGKFTFSIFLDLKMNEIEIWMFLDYLESLKRQLFQIDIHNE